jgi:hypothetical protein
MELCFVGMVKIIGYKKIYDVKMIDNRNNLK